MRAEGETNSTVKTLPRWMSWASTLLACIPGIMLVSGAVYGIMQWGARSATRPRGGYTVSISVPGTENSNEATSTFQGLTVRQYEVFNPGPAPLRKVELQVLVPNEFVNSERPPVGLQVKPINDPEITYERVDGGSRTLCRVAPQICGDMNHVKPGGSFGICFIARSEGWTADRDGTVVRMPGCSSPIPASGPLGVVEREAPFLLTAPVIVTLIIASVMFFLYPLIIYGIARRGARESAEDASADIKAQAITEGAENQFELNKFLGKLRESSAISDRDQPNSDNPESTMT